MTVIRTIWNRVAFLPLFICFIWPQAAECALADTNQLQQGTTPTVGCTASPTKIQLGATVIITANASGNDFIYGFGSSEGTLIVKGNSATLNTAGISNAVRSITIVCSAVNLKGQTIQATTQVTISTPPVTHSLHPRSARCEWNSGRVPARNSVSRSGQCLEAYSHKASVSHSTIFTCFSRNRLTSKKSPNSGIQRS